MVRGNGASGLCPFRRMAQVWRFDSATTDGKAWGFIVKAGGEK